MQTPARERRAGLLQALSDLLKPGGLLMFHGNLVHGSAANITPFPRKIVYLTLNAVSNHIRKPTRPEWIAHTDFTPIEPVADDALLRYARSRQQKAAAE